MKHINEYIREAYEEQPAPESVQKFLGIQYADGVGHGEQINFTIDGDRYGKLYIDRGLVEGQDKVFAFVWDLSNLNKPDAQIAVGTSSRPMGKSVDIMAIYYLNENDAKNGVKYYPGIQHVLCKDIEDIVTNIRNDYGKVSSYKNAGHKKEKDGIIYTY